MSNPGTKGLSPRPGLIHPKARLSVGYRRRQKAAAAPRLNTVQQQVAAQTIAAKPRQHNAKAKAAKRRQPNAKPKAAKRRQPNAGGFNHRLARQTKNGSPERGDSTKLLSPRLGLIQPGAPFRRLSPTAESCRRSAAKHSAAADCYSNQSRQAAAADCKAHRCEATTAQSKPKTSAPRQAHAGGADHRLA